MAENKIQLILEAVDKTGQAFRNAEANLKGFHGHLLSVQTALKGLLAVAPFVAIADMVKKTADTGDELLKFSEITGISVENLSKMKQVAELSETDIETLTKNIGYFNRALHGVNDEGKDTTKYLKALGVTAKDPFEALMQVADAFKNMEDGANKSAIAMELFGRSGIEIIPFLNNGREAVQKMSVMMTTEWAKAANEFNDNIQKLKHNLESLAITISGPLIRSANTLFDSFRGLSRMVEKEGLLKGFFKWATTGKEEMQKYLKEQGIITESKSEGTKKPPPLLIPDNVITKQKEIANAMLAWKNKIAALNYELSDTDRKLLQLYDDAERLKQKAIQEKWGADKIAKINEGLLRGSMEIYAKADKELAKKQYEEYMKAQEEIAKNTEEFEKSITEAKAAESEKRFLEVEEWAKKENNMLLALYGKGTIDYEAYKNYEVEITRLAAEKKRKIEEENLKAIREATINHQLSLLDIAEKERNISKPEAVKERIRLERELLDIQEQYLPTIDKLKDPSSWYAQQNAITETRGKLLELNLALKEQTGTLTDGMQKGLRDYIYDLKTNFQHGVELAKQTAQAMESAFSDFFFDAMQGKLKTLWDYVSGFLRSVLRALAQSLGQQITGGIISGIVSLFAEGGIMTASGPLPLRRYSNGGIAYSPQLAIYGEGRTPEAYVPLPDGRRIPAVVDFKNTPSKNGDINVNIQMENKTGLPLSLKNRGYRADEKTKVKTILLDLIWNDPEMKAALGR